MTNHTPLTTYDAPNTVTEYTSVGNSLMPMARPLPQHLLGVWAHPDDEAYLSAGLMARVIAAGGQVTVVTASRGEKGTDDPSLYDSDVFGAYRERELVASLAELGVTDVRFLGYRDGECECDLADNEEAVTAITDVIVDVSPDTIVTFGPDGMTGHADHQSISRWTTEAWRRAARDSAALLYATVSHDFVARHRELHDSLGVFADRGDEGPASVSRSCVALECSLSDHELDRKRKALAAHRSQTEPLATIMGETAYRTWWNNERFRRPTRSEINGCPIQAWIQQVTTRNGAAQPALAGASA
jgi:LmbE family N-acetylglucosaminyl deacetylase